MGVINVTPNSFSDGGEIRSPDDVLKKIKDFGPVEAVDIGAESTAPKNAPVDSQEEWSRFQEFVLPIIPQIPHHIVLSIDTYHPETIFKLSRYVDDRPFMWNDVSGHVDSDVMNFLVSKTNGSYVLCHNKAPTRALSGSHMDYVSEGDLEAFFWDMVSFFSERMEIFKKKNLQHRIVLDPCFGFSKTLEQNIYLMDQFHHLVREVKHFKWMIGISRKSFLRSLHNTSEVSLLDEKHSEDVLRIISHAYSATIWLRSHRPELLPISL